MAVGLRLPTREQSASLAERINQRSGSKDKVQGEYIEALCAMYLIHTNLNPDEVELVEQRSGIETTWFYRKRQ